MELEIISIIIAGFAALIALGALIYGIFLNRSQRKYVKRQDALNSIYLESEIEAKKPNIKVEIVREGTRRTDSYTTYLQFKNVGKSRACKINYEAKNVPWQFVNHPTLPFEFLNPGDRFKIMVGLTGAFSSHKCIVMWQDEDGQEYKTKTMLTY